MRRVEVEGVRVELPESQPVVLLRDFEEPQVLPIWIGAVEASAIAFAQQGVQPPRPLTHDLFIDVIEALGDRLAEVQIIELRDGVFYASMVFASGRTVSARPSDAIALALRCGAVILVAEEVMAAAGVALPAGEDAEVERFRAFLDQVSAEDFSSGGEAGEGGPEPDEPRATD
jgi:bifunctional DNase/RNase